MPKALAGLRPQAQALADDLADRLVARRGFDAVADPGEAAARDTAMAATVTPGLSEIPDLRQHLAGPPAGQP